MSIKVRLLVLLFGFLIVPLGYGFQPKSIIVDVETASSDDESYHSSDDDYDLMDYEEQEVDDPLCFLPFLKNLPEQMAGNEVLLNGVFHVHEKILSHQKVNIPEHWQKYLMKANHNIQHLFNILTLTFVYLCQLENDDKKNWAEMMDKLIEHLDNPLEEQLGAIGNIVHDAKWEQEATDIGLKPVLTEPNVLRIELLAWINAGSSNYSADEERFDSGFFE